MLILFIRYKRALIALLKLYAAAANNTLIASPFTTTPHKPTNPTLSSTQFVYSLETSLNSGKTIMAEHYLLSSAIIYYNSKMLLDTYVIFYSISHLLFNIRLFQTITFLAVYNTQVQSK